MSIQAHVQAVKDFSPAIGNGDEPALPRLATEDSEWTIRGEAGPLAGTHREQAALDGLLRQACETAATSCPAPPEFVAVGDRMLAVDGARRKIKAANKSIEDKWVFGIILRDGGLKNLRNYIDTQALVRASEMSASAGPWASR